MRKHYDFSKAKRGPVIKPTTEKTRITIRIDSDILDWFRDIAHNQGGASYQTLINRALRTFMESSAEPLEATLRRVLREELKERRAS
jgi:uncharacterized protein (DUF4415 family)